MKILGRPIQRYLMIALNAPQTMTWIVRAFQYFQDPLGVLRLYLKRSLPPDNYIVLRNGYKLKVSNDKSDILTIFSIFCKQDYGSIPANAIVIDIGSNIGVYCVYALYSGAKNVFAFEPSLESFAVLSDNIHDNQLEARASAFPYAIWSEDTTVLFPTASNVMNKVVRQDMVKEAAGKDMQLIQTMTFDSIIKQNHITKVDVLKLDCEGAEYAILESIDSALWPKIENVRLEYHDGRFDQLCSQLAAFGLNLERHMALGSSPKLGIAWFKRSH